MPGPARPIKAAASRYIWPLCVAPGQQQEIQSPEKGLPLPYATQPRSSAAALRQGLSTDRSWPTQLIHRFSNPSRRRMRQTDPLRKVEQARFQWQVSDVERPFRWYAVTYRRGA